MKYPTDAEIDEMSADEARKCLKKYMREADKEDDDEEDDEEDKDDSAKAAWGMRLIGKLLGRGAVRGLFLADCGSVEGEQLIHSFKQLGVPFVASYWGGEARFLSVGRNSTNGVRVPKATVSAEWLAQTMLAGDGLDQIVVSRPGKEDLDLQGAALGAMAGAMRAAVGV